MGCQIEKKGKHTQIMVGKTDNYFYSELIFINISVQQFKSTKSLENLMWPGTHVRTIAPQFCNDLRKQIKIHIIFYQ